MAMAVVIPIAFIIILMFLTATLLVCQYLRRRGLLKQYGISRSDLPDFVPLVNNTQLQYVDKEQPFCQLYNYNV